MHSYANTNYYHTRYIFLSSIDPNYAYYASSDSSVDQYSWLRCGKGGTAVLFKKRWQQFVSRIETHSDRITAIEFKCPNTLPLFMFSVYMPASSNIEEYKNAISELETLVSFYNTRGQLLVAGDFNAQIDSCDINPSSKSHLLKDFVSGYDLHASSNSGRSYGPMYTFKPTRSTLDYFLVDRELLCNVSCSKIVDTESSSSSDHYPLFMSVQCATDDIDVNSRALPPFDRACIAWNKCTELDILKYQDEIRRAALSQGDLDAFSVDELNESIISVLKYSSKSALPKSNFNKFTKPYWSTDLKEAHAHSRRMRRVWISEGRPRGFQHESYRAYKVAKSIFRAKQRLASNMYLNKVYDDLNESAETDFRLFWKLLKRFKRQNNETCQMLKVNSTIFEGNRVVEGFAEHFEQVFRQSGQSDGTHCSDLLYATLNNFTSDTTNIGSDSLEDAITADELDQAILSLKRRKAPGPDGILNEHLINGGLPLNSLLLILFNKILQQEVIPQSWKDSIIIPLYKGNRKCKTDPKSYRPISLVSCLSKLFEKIVLVRYRKFIESNNTVSHFPNAQQQGFQDSLSCITASFNLHECMLHNFELGSNVYICFLDTMAAFDTVWHDALFVKLGELGIRGKMLRLARNSYADMQCQIRIQNQVSRQVPISRGVRQGGVLSSFYYLVFINKLLSELEESGYGARIGNVPCGNPTLADDIALLATSPKNLQLMIDIVYRYTQKWKFAINVSKSNYMIITRSRSLRPPEFKIGDETLNKVNAATHLGITIDDNLKLRERKKLILLHVSTWNASIGLKSSIYC